MRPPTVMGRPVSCSRTRISSAEPRLRARTAAVAYSQVSRGTSRVLFHLRPNKARRQVREVRAALWSRHFSFLTLGIIQQSTWGRTAQRLTGLSTPAACHLAFRCSVLASLPITRRDTHLPPFPSSLMLLLCVGQRAYFLHYKLSSSRATLETR